MTYNIAFVLYPGFEELDFAGPFEVLGAAKKVAAPHWNLFTVATGTPVRGANGLSVNTDVLVEDAPEAAQVLVIPGGNSLGATADEKLMAYIRQAGASAELVASVCTGAFVLWHAGLLRGKRATTYWAAADLFATLEGVTLVNERWVHDGNAVTTAGVSAGIDGALYMVGRLLSPEIAREVQRYIEYDPAPPYADVPTA